MTLLVTESLDGSTTLADLISTTAFTKWTATNVTGLSLVAGRNGNCLRRALSATTYSNKVMWLFASTMTATIFVGGALKLSALPTTDFRLLGGKTNVASGFLGIAVTSTGALQFYATAALTGTDSLTQHGFALTTGVYYYIEVKMPFGASSACECRVNGVVVLTASVNTNESGGTAWEGVVLLSTSTGNTTANIDIDDVYCCDSNGSKNNTYLGDTVIQCVRADAQGSQNAWVNSAASSVNNYSYINENPRDDTNYIQSSVAADRDLHTYPDISAAPYVAGICVNMRAAKTGGTRDLKVVSKNGGSETVSAAKGIGTSLNHVQHIFESDPTGGDWTAALVNANEFGYETV